MAAWKLRDGSWSSTTMDYYGRDYGLPNMDYSKSLNYMDFSWTTMDYLDVQLEL